jgi:hypothetical protein
VRGERKNGRRRAIRFLKNPRVSVPPCETNNRALAEREEGKGGMENGEREKRGSGRKTFRFGCGWSYTTPVILEKERGSAGRFRLTGVGSDLPSQWDRTIPHNS